MTSQALLEPIPGPMSVSTHVLRGLLSSIVDGKLKTGEQLPSEAEIAQQMGVGLSSVREALSALQGMGVISVKHGSGRTVRGLTFAAIADPRVSDTVVNGQLLLQTTAVRELLEVAAIRHAASEATSSDLAEIERAVAEMDAAVHRGELGVEEDGEFHLAIARTTGNVVLVLLQESINSLMNSIRRKSHQQEGRPQMAVDEHRAIAEAIRNGDVENAERLLREHLARGASDAGTYFKD
ncbi:FadR/GntR family transcriptional regulator [Ruicaihuangia caeni]|uniref:FadR/GntR family transcriptional regulator n=1 Tax=Ruicaihuangia caeni TaxID=3042517 RepID=A0AAW6TAT9_9MICO|nr:FadR/GntR family transcriptional regulator [Klugiella sp. YN-L-19]MDI2098928.1 FadR/GntR family transcriptional regulator [Klugiella sp. YN-L-19]